MAQDRRCPRCGKVIPWGEAECPLCSEHRGFLWSLRRDTFLVLVSTVLVAMFAVTGFAVRAYFGRQDRLARDWSKRGEEALAAGHPDAAMVDFRNALFHSRDNPLYEERLAQALVATGSIAQARTYLLGLHDREPGDGTVNLELARLAAREHDVATAVRFYHDAVYSEWEGDAVARRRAVRLELADFLLASNEREAARAELIAVAANLPFDPALRTKVADLLLEVGGYDDALRLFRQVLSEAPQSAAALAGAGECYFQQARYAEAQRYLVRAVQRDPNLTTAASRLDTTRAVLSLDPFQRQVGEEARAHRAKEDWDVALARLQACAGQEGIDLKAPGSGRLQALSEQAAALRPRARESRMQHDPELLSQIMDLIFEIEKTTAQVCGEPQGQDLALLLIARQQEATRP